MPTMNKIVRNIYILKLRKIVMKGRSVGVTTMVEEFMLEGPDGLLKRLILLGKIRREAIKLGVRGIR